MSRNGKNPKLELKLNLSPPRATHSRAVMDSPRGSSSSSSSSPSSCVSSDPENSPGSGSGSMVLAGCPRCLMYVMLSERDPRCPKCKSTVLLDFLHEKNKGGKN